MLYLPHYHRFIFSYIEYHKFIKTNPSIKHLFVCFLKLLSSHFIFGDRELNLGFGRYGRSHSTTSMHVFMQSSGNNQTRPLYDTGIERSSQWLDQEQ